MVAEKRPVLTDDEHAHDHDLLVVVSYRLQRGDLIVFYSPFRGGEKGAAPV